MTPESLALNPIPHPLGQLQPPAVSLPTMYDLPSENPEEPGLPDEFHNLQPQLLRETFQPPHYPLKQVFFGTDLNLYYDPHHPMWHKRPDWFVVLGVPCAVRQEDLRWSYVIWQEGVSPFLVVELLSPGTEAEDLGQTERQPGEPPTKWEVYEQILGIPYYVVFDRNTNQFRVFCLVDHRLKALELPEARLWLPEVELGLGVWRGEYQGVAGLWLRWYDQSNQWLPTPAEQAEQEHLRAEQEHLRAEQERLRAEQERLRADRLADRLRELGLDPDQL